MMPNAMPLLDPNAPHKHADAGLSAGMTYTSVKSASEAESSDYPESPYMESHREEDEMGHPLRPMLVAAQKGGRVTTEIPHMNMKKAQPRIGRPRRIDRDDPHAFV